MQGDLAQTLKSSPKVFSKAVSGRGDGGGRWRRRAGVRGGGRARGTACWILVPDQVLNQHPLHWKTVVLTTGPPEKSLAKHFKKPGEGGMEVKVLQFMHSSLIG